MDAPESRTEECSADRSTLGTQAEPEPSALPVDMVLGVLRHLPPNEVACTARLLCKEASRHFTAQHHRTVRLSQPIPAHASTWWCGEEALRHLSYKGRLGVLSMAAASGCDTNLEVAWRLLGPCFFPDMPPASYVRHYAANFSHPTPPPDPGTAAARAGHVHLLPWLVAHPSFLDPVRTLEAVAEHCDLPALQQAWELLQPGEVGRSVLAAARSRVPSVLGKLVWLVEEKGCDVDGAVAAAAAQGGCIACLRWLQERGADVSQPPVVCAALRHASMEAVRWVWQQRPQQVQQQQQQQQKGEVPPAEDDALEQGQLLELVKSAASSSVEGVAKLCWLRGRGYNVESHGKEALCSAARAGRLEVVQHLVEECGVEVEQGQGELAGAMGLGGDLRVMDYLAQRGVGKHTVDAYEVAASRGDLAAVRWLVREGFGRATCLIAPKVVRAWPVRGNPGCSASVEEDCLEALKVLVQAGQQPDFEVLISAAQRGSLPAVRWLVEEQGCTFGDDAFAAKSGSAAVLEWMLAKGCPHAAAHVGQEYVWPGKHGDRATLQLLRQLGVPWGDRTLSWGLLEDMELPVLRWLVDNGLPLQREEVAKMMHKTAREQHRAWCGAWLEGQGLAGEVVDGV